jgi:hypothetical protein
MTVIISGRDSRELKRIMWLVERSGKSCEWGQRVVNGAKEL